MSNDEQVIKTIEDSLDAALGGIQAPPGFAAAVTRRVRESRPSRLPEILDFIGWLAVLAAAAVLLVCFAPRTENVYWTWTLAAAITLPALWFGWRSALDLGD